MGTGCWKRWFYLQQRAWCLCVGRVGGCNLPCAAVEREISRSLSANGAKRLRPLSSLTLSLSHTHTQTHTCTHTHTYTHKPSSFQPPLLLFISFVFSLPRFPPSLLPTFIHSCFLWLNFLTLPLRSFDFFIFPTLLSLGIFVTESAVVALHQSTDCFGHNRADLWHPALLLPSLPS